MVKRKKSGGGGANWMDTYGDMVTLLLCFFVLLYSMSTISEEKWKAIVTSFNPFAQQTPTDPNGKGGPIADPELGETGVNEPDSDKLAEQEEIDDMLAQIAQAIEQMAKDEGLESAISVELNGGKIYVKFSDSVFFAGDSYVLRPHAQEIMTKLCGVLDEGKKAIEEIRVQGHTAQAEPSKPNRIEGDRRLASNRATTVVIFLMEHSSIHPARLISEGFGQWRPIGDNKDEAGRAPNRRVEMIISGVNILEDSGLELSEELSHYISLSGREDSNP